ncbi:hypothetical protein DFS34DRAFT_600257 [Phlyctochytrium arcticum]|nr:hypothetical protein DFS34DRAFT_600257 [Phlyctochytrium arcticum]
MANDQSWTDASEVIKNVWQLADCYSSYHTFDGTSWSSLEGWDKTTGRVRFQKEAHNSNSFNTTNLALLNDINARAACINHKGYLIASNVRASTITEMWKGDFEANFPPRSGYTLLSTKTRVLAIGGQLPGAVNNTVKTLVGELRPSDPQVQWVHGPDLPYAVNQSSAAAWGESGAVLFGGQSEQNPVPLMRWQNNEWSALEATGFPPSPRIYPCVATSATTMYVYGGRPLNVTAQPDPLLHELNLESLTWTNYTLSTTTNTTHPSSISDVSCSFVDPRPPTAVPYLHVFTQISTPTFQGPAMQVLDLNTKTWQALNGPIFVTTRLPSIQPSSGYASDDGRPSTFITVGIPVILGSLVLICFAWCVKQTRGCAEVTPANMDTTNSSGPVPPSIPECPPTSGPDDIEMGDLARAIRESEIEATTNQTSLSSDIPTHAPPSYDDVISDIATVPDNDFARPSTNSTTQSDPPHPAVLVHDTSSASTTAAIIDKSS